ncbi:hydroxymethylglutaryl-CoA synthase [Infirmifilum sp. NZ]|uniref:hydroxymethylglutaryl-CoA synthase n=1 Tax=Infirmifilum sp. NZ TaxID=2926850 RepID=UPI00279C3B81|nr:hydroxymethylglutaryl-CoA synthase [Infirmifilum sp. NZ]UNQ72827.1 hydroxymethylglutaryl-CoA synthase [Infirmifilum sp. NZ]
MKGLASIYGYGAYIPIYRIETKEIARVHTKGGEKAPVKTKSLPGPDEDSLTIAYEAAKNALKRAGIDPSLIEALYIGSESPPYAVKPSATVIAEALGFSRKLYGIDMEFACKAGTTAVISVAALVSAGVIKYGVGIGTDTAQGRPGDELEYTAAAGAAAYVLGPLSRDSVATIEHVYSYVTDTPDFWRREGEKFPMHTFRFTGDPAYFHHIESAARGLMEETGLKPSDFNYVVFHQPNVKFPQRMAQMLGFTEEQLRLGLLSGEIGNTYAAASLIGLANVLDHAKPGERILVVSFGSGAGSDALSIVVEEGIEARRKLAPKVSHYLSRKKLVDYAYYLKYRRYIHGVT